MEKYYIIQAYDTFNQLCDVIGVFDDKVKATDTLRTFSEKCAGNDFSVMISSTSDTLILKKDDETVTLKVVSYDLNKPMNFRG